MANSPSQVWKDGVLVQRAIETNRWKVPSDTAPAEDEEEKTTTKAISSTEVENKSVKQAAKK